MGNAFIQGQVGGSSFGGNISFSENKLLSGSCEIPNIGLHIVHYSLGYAGYIRNGILRILDGVIVDGHYASIYVADGTLRLYQGVSSQVSYNSVTGLFTITGAGHTVSFYTIT